MGSFVNRQVALKALLCSSSILLAWPAMAQEAASVTPSDNIVVTGSRFGDRTVQDSPTPIDAVSAEQLTKGGGNDLQSMIKVAIPSFSTPRPSSVGTSDYLQSPTLRGLSTGQLLLMVNGKRRHTNSELNTNNQIGRGDVAYDFGAIPAFAIKSVQVLRDGAAAQYGSDAIGGVVNIMLEDKFGVSASGKGGITTHGDGQHLEGNVAVGLPLGSDGGVIRVTGMYVDHNHTDRARPDTRQQYFGTDANGNLVMPSSYYGSGTGLTASNGTLDAREATFNRDIWVFGEPDYTNKALFANAKLPVGDFEAYAFGGWNKLDGTTYNFLRRAGQNETVRAIHPDGYLPLNAVVLENYSGTGGLRGEAAGFGIDVSTTYGQSYTSQADYNTNNVTYGADSPTSFFRGSSQFDQWTTNLDFTRDIPLGDGSPLQIAFGAEYRKEWYKLGAGSLESYTDGGVAILDGPNAGKQGAVGSQPTPGLPPSSATSGSRNAKSVYGEIQKVFFEKLLLDAAIRYEHYSDFGSTTNYKFAGRFDVTDWFALRGSYGTGFRAPALAQIYYNSSTTNFLNGNPVAIRLVSTADPLSALIGAPELKPEKSKNLSAGAVLSLGKLSIAADYYRIKLEDRLALSGTFSGTALVNYLTANGYPNISSVSFVTNGVDTTSQGVDVTATWSTWFSDVDELSVTLAGNYNHAKIDNVVGTPGPLAAIGITTPLVDLTQQVRLTQSTPDSKVTLNFNWKHDWISTNLTLTRYGKVSQVALTNKTQAQVDALLLPGYDVTLVPNGNNYDMIQHFGADVVADLEVAFKVNEQFTFTLGASNLFDNMPDEQIASTVESVAAGTNGADNNGIYPYAYIAPYGTSGRFLYAKVKVDF
ncbi:TonB-dependent receptor [Novosphingobium indicum]|uniref:TonB-dependent receptor n=1 Tax=Novosphingobium indicum TaxID=462949 RepID=A0ABQ2K1X6_9SPHN|nr:TonB-dependent receptor [Novosphingobium indicum]GGN61585.1 TonB-dependent receptor [Novosphingobium indicum]